jgi:plastocyanin
MTTSSATSSATPRADRRAAALEARRAERARQAAAERRAERTKQLAFGGIVIAVLAIGGALAFGDFFNRPGAAPGQITVQSSMAGFSPSVITVKAGTTVTLDWWTQDAAVHLTGGVHTMISDELGLYEVLPAESRQTVTWNVPNRPGTYDVYCDTCCGGKDAPQMHGKIVILPADQA